MKKYFRNMIFRILFAMAISLSHFLLSGCMCTKWYAEDVVELGRYSYCEEPFDSGNKSGYYIGTQELDGSLYDIFVFKNLIKTDGDKYIKIALPHNEDYWHEEEEYPYSIRIPHKEDEYPRIHTSGYSSSPQASDYDKSERRSAKGLIIRECGAEDFDEEKKLAYAEINPAFMSTKVLFLSCNYYSPKHNKYQFGFFVPAKAVMSIYKKGRGFPVYIFTYLGFPGPMLVDVITFPGQVFLYWLFSDFRLGG